MSGDRRCQRCGHDYKDHGRRGGRCDHTTYTEQRIEGADLADGIELRQDWSLCDCAYFSGSYFPADFLAGR